MRLSWTPFLWLSHFVIAVTGKQESDRCEAPADAGPCQFFQVKWFWDPPSKQCRQFNYGGCLGNQNRFHSKEACEKQCLYKFFDTSIMPELCLLDPDPAYCGNSAHDHSQSSEISINPQWWYFFNLKTGTCEQFLYYGCGPGNNNRFYSLYQCRKICGERLEPQIACDKCDIRVSYCKFFSKYNSTCECRKGYEKKSENGECVDSNECERNTSTELCGEHASCRNTIGSYKCDCDPGNIRSGKRCVYVGIGTLSVKCSECSPNATCDSLTSVCQCKLGFIGDGYNCTDVDECAMYPNICDENAECENLFGSFSCHCREGFAGNGYSCDKDPVSCIERFDRKYTQWCKGSDDDWRQHYYLEPETKQCTMFWYNGCESASRNIFSHLSTCQEMCEQSRILAKAVPCSVAFKRHRLRLQVQIFGVFLLCVRIWWSLSGRLVAKVTPSKAPWGFTSFLRSEAEYAHKWGQCEKWDIENVRWGRRLL
ncbi:kunitz/Bovine pancreatic trypsin inhibitor domain-containing protein [Ditylenchus destructor]|uniref:Kunitz/Bovine pancreatic trypsin inhibitor domain-containing protein n=1 Tax=Ditylenchus destructor TaxID=166010 RepID=A0AAD4MJK7_9BILA|nr:kunitz/Bovine pancreatic trypsin inhibitor domain-containing protein [Ditylenchus destructor]